MGGRNGSTVLAPFGVASFRVQWPADLLTSLAFEMETLVLGWYVLVTTGSVLWLTAFGALQFHGTLLSPMLGVAGDRIGHRNLLCLMRAVYALIALLVMVLAFAGALGPALVLCLAAATGCVRPSDLAVRGATVAANVPAGLLVGAMGISRSTSDVARIFGGLMVAGILAKLGLGPDVASLLATLDLGPVYVIIAGLYGVGLLLTLCVKRPAANPAAGDGAARTTVSPWRDLREGLTYVWTTPRLLAAMWLAFLMNLTTLPLTGGLLPFVAKGVYLTDQSGLGLLSASFAFGALFGSIVLGVAGSRMRLARMMIGSALIWCLLLLIFTRMETLAGGIAMLIIIGFVHSLCMVTMAVMLLKTSEERLRGRVMGVRMLAICSQVLGLLAAGALIERYGFGWTASLYTGVALLFTLLIALRWQGDLLTSRAIANSR